MKNIVDLLLKIDAKEIGMPKGEHKMFCKKIGQEFTFPIEAIDPERISKIQEQAIDISKGEVNKINTYHLKVFTILEGCPDVFKNKELQEHFNAHTAKELVKKLLLSGEMDSLNNAINNLNGVQDEEKVIDEIKN